MFRCTAELRCDSVSECGKTQIQGLGLVKYRYERRRYSKKLEIKAEVEVTHFPLKCTKFSLFSLSYYNTSKCLDKFFAS